MSLYDYIPECHGLAVELMESMSDFDVDELRSDCNRLGVAGWHSWCYEQNNEIRKFVKATPSQRRSRKKWQAPELRRRLTLAGVLHLKRAKLMMEAADFLKDRVGGPYREVADQAGDMANNLFRDILYSNWPFEDPNPFTQPRS